LWFDCGPFPEQRDKDQRDDADVEANAGDPCNGVLHSNTRRTGETAAGDEMPTATRLPARDVDRTFPDNAPRGCNLEDNLHFSLITP
jgi:hypothetical protein